MRVVFSVQYDIVGEQSGAELLNAIVGELKTWISTKYVRTWSRSFDVPDGDFSEAPLTGHTITARSVSLADHDLYEVEWKHPHDSDLSASWVTGCTIARSGDRVSFGITVRLTSEAIVLRPLGFTFGTPGIVRELLTRYQVFVGSSLVRSDVFTIGAAGVPEFVHEVLLDTERALPVVVVSSDPWSDQPLIDPRVLQRQIAGLANVVYLENKWAGFKLSEMLGKQRSAYNGAVRVYWPGFSIESSPFDHHLYLPDQIQSETPRVFARNLFHFLTGIAILRFRDGQVVSETRREIERLEEQRIAELRNQVERGTATEQELTTEIETAWHRAERAEKERDGLLDDLAALKKQLETTQKDLEAQRASWRQVQEFKQTVPVAATETEPEGEFRSVEAAFLAAKQRFSGPLLFLESALRSAKDSPFKQPDRVFELFEAMYEIATQWKKHDGALGQRWETAFETFGFDYRPTISQTSEGKWAKDYTFVYDGVPRLFESHVTIGKKGPDSCLSVHFYRDDDNLVLVIGHCGRHLTNTST